jgi:hypothetical protein
MMIGRKQKRNATAPARRTGKRSWLSTEIELIIRERERLLQAAGAGAALFTALNIRELSTEARVSLHALGATLASLSDETLADAMESLWSAAERRQAPAS